MTDIPADPNGIRARIRRYERKLQQEKREWGAYHDGAGKRYFIGPLYLLMGDLAGAVQSFHWFAQEFPDDSGDPGQYLCWTLAMYRAGHLHEAVSKLREAMLQNRFLLPRLLGRNVEGLGISPDSDELEMMRLDHIPEEYFAIWGERELRWASTLYDGELSTVRARYLEIERELEHEPRGERRVRLVNELFGMKHSNRQDRPD
jgi:tetratricopeptide (TPR) repeat protein